jgi:hypothetical protein
MLECGIELGERAAPIVLVEQMGETIAEAIMASNLPLTPRLSHRQSA